MRKRPCPEGARTPRRGAFAALLVLAGLALATAAGLHAQAEKGLVIDRVDRVRTSQADQQAEQKSDTEAWSAAKVVINLDARCPVVTTLGYFGAFAVKDTDPAKTAELQSRFAKLQAIAQPMADELRKMAVANAFVGRKFPAALVPRLHVMCGELYGSVQKLYGDESLAELKNFVATQALGVYVQD